MRSNRLLYRALAIAVIGGWSLFIPVGEASASTECVCCYEEFSTWPLKDHQAFETTSEDCLGIIGGDLMAAAPGGAHSEPLGGSCMSHHYSSCSGLLAVSAARALRAGALADALVLSAGNANVEVRFNWIREAVQLYGCSGEVVLHQPLGISTVDRYRAHLEGTEDASL